MIDPLTMLQDGGPYTLLVVATALVLLAALGVQFNSLKTRDLRPLLWSLCAAVLMFGLCGKISTDIAYYQGMVELDKQRIATQASYAAMSAFHTQTLTSSMYPWIIALLLTLPLGVGSALATALVQRHQGETAS